MRLVRGLWASRAAKALARSWSWLPATPWALSQRAAASRDFSASITSAGGRSRPASAAVPAGSAQTSTRASFCACSRRRFAPSGSWALTAWARAAPSSPVVCRPARGAIFASTAAASSSDRTARWPTMTSARLRLMIPLASRALVWGRRARSRARPVSSAAPRPVRVSSAAISSSTCSPGRPPGPARRAVEFGDGGELACGVAGGLALVGGDHAAQLVIGQPTETCSPHCGQMSAQFLAGQHLSQHATRRESATLTRDRVGAG